MYFIMIIIIFPVIYAIEQQRTKEKESHYYTSLINDEESIKESGNNWITIENVVVGKNSITARSYFKINPKDYEEFSNIYNKIFPHYFYSFFIIVSTSADNYYIWPNEEGIWYSSSFCNTLYHRWDTFMLYVIDNDKKYPPINEVIFDSYEGRIEDYEMQNYYNTILENKLSKSKFYYQEEMSKLYRKYGYIFFKKIHILFRSGYNQFYFVNRNKASEFRDFGMNITKIQINEINNNLINICLLKRQNSYSTRNIINLNEIYSILMNLKNHILNKKIDIEIISFDGINSVEQIKLMVNRNIVISPHGAGLVNMLWILKSKVTIIEGYSIFITDAYLKLSTVFGFLYFPLSSVKIYDDLNIYYDFENEKNSSFYYNNYPQIHHNVFSNHPLRHARSSIFKLDLKQILYGIFYSFIFINHF